MKVVILAGGLGTRLSEETDVKPKPMVEIGGRPILWHIMKIFGHHGFDQFLVALGYRGDVVKRFFLDYARVNANLTIDVGTGAVQAHDGPRESWSVQLVDTGFATLTGGRLKRLAPLLGSATFMMTYGDGVADVDLPALLAFHRAHGRLATVTAVRPPARYGGLEIEHDRVVRFEEKPLFGERRINGGFFVLEPGVLDYIAGDDVYFEHAPMERLVRDGELFAYCHDGFWQSMDTLRDVRLLNEAWTSGKAPWKLWS